jgi:hypothetical protein
VGGLARGAHAEIQDIATIVVVVAVEADAGDGDAH